MTIRLGRYFGIFLRIGIGSNGLRYLYGVVWYPRGRNRLGYLYPSIRV
jgi:hypothetical protein